MKQVINREDWLNRAAIILDEELFKPSGYTVPKNIRYTIGFPLGSTRNSKKNETIGQCFSSIVSNDGHYEVMINPKLEDHEIITGTLLHEMVHAVVGLDAGHKKPFKDCALEVGLEGKMTATSISKNTWEFIKDKIDALGKIPHGAMTITAKKPNRKKVGTIKGECLNTGLTARMTRSAVEKHGSMGKCPCCDIEWSFDRSLIE